MKVLIFLVFFNSSLVHAEKWNSYNNPANMDLERSYVYNVFQLPMKGSLDVLPWSESYWPTYKGSINYRWNASVKDGFYYTPYSKSQILKMSVDELKTLSPSEKYDIYMGAYDYPLYNEARSYGNPRAKDWSGICDGWSIASIQYAEPASVMLVNPDGVIVPFGSSDVKGLMSFAAAIHFKVETRQVGTKCGWSGGGCDDINPGAMHVILANQIGYKKQGFVTERDPGSQIWNQPTYGYEFTLLGSANSESGASGVRVHGILRYTDELENSSWDPVVGTPKFKSDKIEMDYVLDLNSTNNIIGGYWINGSDHPDFIWLPTNHLEFKDSLAGINQIYKAAAR